MGQPGGSHHQGEGDGDDIDRGFTTVGVRTEAQFLQRSVESCQHGSAGAVNGLGAKAEKWKAALVVSGLLLLVGWTAYYFWLEQMFVKRYGGVMTISVPDGHYHITTTWKDDHLWVENYDPRTNTCVFSEYSKGNLLQGKVTIKNCNPLRGN